VAKKTCLLDARNTAFDLAPVLKGAWSITSTYETLLKNQSFDSQKDESSLRINSIAAIKRLKKLQDKLNKEIEDALNNLSDSLKAEVSLSVDNDSGNTA
jgi:hypothetical protein